jgi:hypothetical protein
MKATIEVKDRSEKHAIEQALTDPATRAFVVITGTLMQLPTDRARARVLDWVADKLREEQEQQQELTLADLVDTPA